MKPILTLVLTVTIAITALADIQSGPKVGDKVEEFKVFGVTGKIEGKEVSYVADRKDEPTVYVFVQQEHWTRPMARFLKTLDKQSTEANDKSTVVAVWLGDKVDMIKDYLPKANQSLQFANTNLTVFQGEKSGPNGWGINTDAHITVVVTNKGKIAASFAFQSVNETDVKKVEEALKKTK